MEWSAMAMFGGDSCLPSADADGGVDEVYDYDNDFYDDDGAQVDEQHVPVKPLPETIPNTNRPVQFLQQQTSDAKKAENEKRAQELRAKLLANRQNTPAKIASPVPTTTGSKLKAARPVVTQAKSASPRPAVAPSTTPPSSTQPATTMSSVPAIEKAAEKAKESEKPRAIQELDQLEANGDLAELFRVGKARADAEAAALNASTADTTSAVAQTNGVRATSPKPPAAKQGTTAPPPAKQRQQKQEHQQNQQLQLVDSSRPTNLTDSYYADLPAWLELTGYHDVDFRTAKLRTYKERKELEEEAARIAARLEALRQKEEAEMQQLRAGTPMASAQVMAPPPPLPQNMPAIYGVKRGRSPEATAEKVSRRREDHGGFRIRGANDSPEARPGAGDPHSPSTNGMERRVSYPEARRRSIDDRAPRSRDHSLERRQSYYRRDDDPPREYDHYSGPRGTPRGSYGNNYRQQRTPAFKSSIALDVRKGGQYQPRP